jgi:hypothetical protein
LNCKHEKQPDRKSTNGGVLDDLFGAVIPDVSQSMGDRELPFSERFKKAWPVLKGGLITLPLAFAMGWFSAKLYGMSASVVIHMLAGALFALACCLKMENNGGIFPWRKIKSLHNPGTRAIWLFLPVWHC